jgi:hypothetical protein
LIEDAKEDFVERMHGVCPSPPSWIS